MATNFPGAIDSPTNPISNNPLNSPTHAGQHQFENDSIVALETKVGANSSATTTSFDYKLSGVLTGDKAVSLTGAEVLSSKTLTAPLVNVGSDATGDIYYRSAGGVLTRLSIGSTLQILSVSAGGLPIWVANPSASTGSTTVAGIFQKAVTADITAGTTTGSTGALLVIGADAVGAAGANKLVQYNSSGQLPAVDGSLLTNLPTAPQKNGVATVPTSASTQTIAHGLGKIPKVVRIDATKLSDISGHGAAITSYGTYNGTTVATTGIEETSNSTNYVPAAFTDTTHAIYLQTYGGGGTPVGCQATIAVDATNITLTWTAPASGTYSTVNNGSFNWEVS